MRTAAVLLLVAATTAAAQDAPPAPPRAEAAPPADAAEKRDRRERLARLAGADAAVLVFAADDSPGFTGSTQNRDFTYLSPFDARGAAVVLALRPGAGPTDPTTLDDRLYLRAKNPAGEAWTGPVAGPGEATRSAGRLAAAPGADRLASDVAELVRTRKTLYVSAGGPADGTKLIAPLLASLRRQLAGVWVRVLDGPAASRDDFAESVRAALPERLPRDRTPLELLDAAETLDVKSAWALASEMRERKSDAEVARIRAAVDATVAGMLDALRAAKPGMTEMQVAALVELRCKLAGCARMAYPSIVGSGPNSCVLHYAAGERELAQGDLVVMDVGGEFRGYAADVTRTFPAGGKFTEEQSRVYDAVLAAQEAAIAAVRPGATIKDVHRAASDVLKERGLVQHFIHGTSHSVGLDVHDPFRPDAPLRAGCVITVEPGVYVAKEALGVRIEDTVLVTDDGCEVLSAGVPKTRDALEKLMAQDPPR